MEGEGQLPSVEDTHTPHTRRYLHQPQLEVFIHNKVKSNHFKEVPLGSHGTDHMTHVQDHMKHVQDHMTGAPWAGGELGSEVNQTGVAAHKDLLGRTPSLTEINQTHLPLTQTELATSTHTPPLTKQLRPCS